MSIRPVASTSQAMPALEGAGVHLHRAFGFTDPTMCDPFLMLDDFRNDDPSRYQAGFPGIRTVASKQLPTFSRGRWNTRIAWGTMVFWDLDPSNG